MLIKSSATWCPHSQTEWITLKETGKCKNPPYSAGSSLWALYVSRAEILVLTVTLMRADQMNCQGWSKSCKSIQGNQVPCFTAWTLSSWVQVPLEARIYMIFLCLYFLVYVEAFRWVDPLLMESYQMSENCVYPEANSKLEQATWFNSEILKLRINNRCNK
jgi:hypothetical protein